MTVVSESKTPPAKPTPLFVLDFKANGGRFAPTSLDDLRTRIEVELTYWSWITSKPAEQHEQGIRESIQSLARAREEAGQAKNFEANNPDNTRALLSNVENRLNDLYIRKGFPHSSAPVAKRIQELRSTAGAEAASYYAAVVVPGLENQQIHPTRVHGWRGLVEGVSDRFNLPLTLRDAKVRATLAAAEQARGQVESLLGEKTEVLNSLHREFEKHNADIRGLLSSQADEFQKLLTTRASAFDEQLSAYNTQLDALKKLFREELALRAPADYWKTKRSWHIGLSAASAVAAFGGIWACASKIATEVQRLLQSTPLNSPPESWRIVTLALFSLFGIWAIRLVVRFFLSQMHLATDAAERVVMVKTYLSLIEGDRLASRDDRQLILQALFRPSSDGLVKDEGLPPNFIEMLTRSPRP